MLSVYKSSVKYSHKTNHILKDLNGLEIKISMKTIW